MDGPHQGLPLSTIHSLIFAYYAPDIGLETRWGESGQEGLLKEVGLSGVQWGLVPSTSDEAARVL